MPHDLHIIRGDRAERDECVQPLHAAKHPFRVQLTRLRPHACEARSQKPCVLPCAGARAVALRRCKGATLRPGLVAHVALGMPFLIQKCAQTATPASLSRGLTASVALGVPCLILQRAPSANPTICGGRVRVVALRWCKGTMFVDLLDKHNAFRTSCF